jgi:Bacterial Ig-like domain (group 3)
MARTADILGKAAATSNPVNVNITKALPSMTTFSVNSIDPGNALAMSAQPQGIAGFPVTGSITFYSGKLIFGTVALTGNANLVVSGLPIGTYFVAADYSGDNNYLGNTSSVITAYVGIIGGPPQVCPVALPTP